MQGIDPFSLDSNARGDKTHDDSRCNESKHSHNPVFQSHQDEGDKSDEKRTQKLCTRGRQCSRAADVGLNKFQDRKCRGIDTQRNKQGGLKNVRGNIDRSNRCRRRKRSTRRRR